MKDYLPENLKTGVEVIDNQHGALLYLISKVEKAFREMEGRNAIKKSVLFLENYVKNHFKTEEFYMEKFQYPDILLHRQEHEKLRKDFAIKRVRILSGIEFKEALSILELLRKWYANHILKTDLIMAKFLKQHLNGSENIPDNF